MEPQTTREREEGDINDPTSIAYKRALRHRQKSLANDSSGSAQAAESWSAFRVQEKKYKARFPRPVLDEVLDVRRLFEEQEKEKRARGDDDDDDAVFAYADDDLGSAGWILPRSEPSHANPNLRASRISSEQVAYRVHQVPGLVILPRFVSPEEQRALVRSSLRIQARSPNETNLDAHYDMPQNGLWNQWEESSSSNEENEPEILIYPKAQLGITHPPPEASQRTLINNIAASLTNLTTLISTPKPPPEPSSTIPPTPLSQLLYKLRWANIGRSYHWGTKSYDFGKRPGVFPEDVRSVCKRAVRAVPWKEIYGTPHDTDSKERKEGNENGKEDWGEDGEDWETWYDSYEPDAGIVNFYQPKDTLMGHVDRSELSSTTPLVSISIGNAAIFLIGGLTRDIKPIPILLRSGDVVIMSGPSCRRAYHGVPRILEGTLPSCLRTSEAEKGGDEKEVGWAPFSTYMQTTRININVRQVFPRGFVPPSSVPIA